MQALPISCPRTLDENSRMFASDPFERQPSIYPFIYPSIYPSFFSLRPFSFLFPLFKKDHIAH